MTRGSHPTWVTLFALVLTAEAICNAQGSSRDTSKKGATPAQQIASGALAVASDTSGSFFVDGIRKMAIVRDKVVTLILIRVSTLLSYVMLKETSSGKRS